MKKAAIYIGASGFSYPGWRGIFYPPELPSREHFRYYSERFSTVEINYTFYRQPSEKTLRRWRAESPEGFLLALKASRFITHRKRLRGAEEAVGKFLALARLLGEKLGPVLFQLPPSLKQDLALLEDFLGYLPDGIRFAVEFRHPSWDGEDLFQLLGKYGVAYCMVSAPKLPARTVATTDFCYVRFHGITSWYSYNYTDKDLVWWAERLSALCRPGIELFAFFNNDFRGYAVKNALWFRELVEKRSQKPWSKARRS